MHDSIKTDKRSFGVFHKSKTKICQTFVTETHHLFLLLGVGTRHYSKIPHGLTFLRSSPNLGVCPV